VQLGSIYSSPGFLLLATDQDGERLGCIGLKQLSPEQPAIGEVRRLFVRKEGRSLGLGRSLTEDLITRAIASGFQRLVLNTLPAMVEAIALYRSLGFEEIDSYADEPLEDTLYFGLILKP
jgi:putative acetyltransferase